MRWLILEFSLAPHLDLILVPQTGDQKAGHREIVGSRPPVDCRCQNTPNRRRAACVEGNLNEPCG